MDANGRKCLRVLCMLVLVVGCATTGQWRDCGAENSDGTINALIEIPAGTNAKWEVNKDTGQLEWEIKNGRPRVVKYLPYPANYGMIPGTMLSEEKGGDGDPLDVIVLGPAVKRGTVVRARLLGVLKMLDGGEKDDKLVAVAAGSPFENVQSIDELHAKFNGVTAILETWFSNYKGPGEIETKGFEGPDAARRLVGESVKK